MRKHVAFVLLAALCAAPVAWGNGSASSSRGGQSVGEWMTAYWSWFYGVGFPGQVKSTIFMPLPEGTPSTTDPTVSVGNIDVSLQPGQKFVLPVSVYIGETYREQDVPDDDPASIPRDFFMGEDVLVTLDGKTIIDSSRGDLPAFYFDTQYFDAPVIYPTPNEYAPDVHAIGEIWVKGIGFVHEPLSKGTHTIHLSVYNDAAGFGFDNTWNVTVGRH